MAALMQKWMTNEVRSDPPHDHYIRERFVIRIDDAEMEWLHNALGAFLVHLRELRERDEEDGILQVEVGNGQMMVVNDVLIDSYVQVRQLRAELVQFASRDMTVNG